MVDAVTGIWLHHPFFQNTEIPIGCIEQSSKGEFSVKQLASMASGPDYINLMSSKAC